jgi:hypothetical protein
MSEVEFAFGPPDIGILCTFQVGPWGGYNIYNDKIHYKTISLELTITIPKVEFSNS